MVSVVTQVFLFDNDWQQVQCLRPRRRGNQLPTGPLRGVGGWETKFKLCELDSNWQRRTTSVKATCRVITTIRTQNAPTILSTPLSLWGSHLTGVRSRHHCSCRRPAKQHLILPLSSSYIPFGWTPKDQKKKRCSIRLSQERMSTNISSRHQTLRNALPGRHCVQLCGVQMRSGG